MSPTQICLDDIDFLPNDMDSCLIPLSRANPRAVEALERNRFLGSGTFCSVYDLSSSEVVKFSWDLDTLLLLQRLGEKSKYFPKVYELYADGQAVNERGEKYFAAVVEKLREDRPKWSFDLITHYRQPWPVVSSSQSFLRLLSLRHEISTGGIFVDPVHVAGLSEAIGLLAEECKSNQLVGDLRADANIMMREDGHIVIADPAHPQKYMQDN